MNKDLEYINRQGKTEDAHVSRSDPRLNDAVGQGLGSDRLTESGGRN